MKISTKGRYGLRAIVDIALNGEKDAVSISSISERQSISVSYLEQLLAKLRKAELIKSIRGAQGGYRGREPHHHIQSRLHTREDEGRSECRQRVCRGGTEYLRMERHETRCSGQRTLE